MEIRKYKEELEEKILSPYASLSKNSKGRIKYEDECDIRTIYQRDRDRILHSKAFRRLKHKTQVFISPEGDHYRTRLTHTLEVSQISRTIANSLRLNEDLTEAIALGHDLGHTPFGHSGERVLSRLNKNGFKHNVQSLRVIDLLERRNENNGLNLTYEVRDGILNHSGEDKPFTLEGQVVRIADRIAYINHDMDDALRAGVISKDEIDVNIIKNLGERSSDRIDTMIRDIIKNSLGKKSIEMSSEVMYYMNDLRDFLFENVYSYRGYQGEEEKVDRIIEELYNYYLNNIDELPLNYLKLMETDGKEQIVTDYIAGMTDRYIVNRFEDLFIPDRWY